MSRDFHLGASTDQHITLGIGTIDANGAYTVMYYGRPSTSGSKGLISGYLDSVGASNSELAITKDGTDYFSASAFSGFTATNDGDFQIVGYSKAAGSDTVEWHFWNETSGTWSHGAGVTEGDISIDRIIIGAAFGAERMRGIFVCAAIWNSELSNAAIESACSPTALQSWFDSSPASLWDGNQATTSEDILDRMGNGADQLAVAGTPPEVSATEPTGWSYTISSSQTLSPSVIPSTSEVFTAGIANQSALGLNASAIPSTSQLFSPTLTNQTSITALPSFISSSSVILQPTLFLEGANEPILVGSGSLADQIMAGLISQGFVSGSLADREYDRLLARLGLAYTGIQTLVDLYTLAGEEIRVIGEET